jgi:uncharacterized membrane protein YtjA (UPF0391 family)
MANSLWRLAIRPQQNWKLILQKNLPINGNRLEFYSDWGAGMLYVLITTLSNLKLKAMLRWTVIFLVVAIIAAIFGFGGIAAGAAGIAKILFFIFLVLFVLSLIFGRRSTDV